MCLLPKTTNRRQCDSKSVNRTQAPWNGTLIEALLVVLHGFLQCFRNMINFDNLLLLLASLNFLVNAAIPIIQLNDNTPNDLIVAGNVLRDVGISAGPGGQITYALLKTAVNDYFRVDANTGKLMTRRNLDRDALCHESGLCCTQRLSQTSKNAQLSSVRGGVHGGDSGSVCSLRLDVAVTTEPQHGSVPRVFQVPVEIRDENDHTPVFVVS